MRLGQNHVVLAGLVCTLAIGGTLAGAVLSALSAAIWQPLPVRAPDQLITFQGWVGDAPVSDYANPDVFSHLASFSLRWISVTTQAGERRVLAAEVSPSFFETLGINPIRGRTFRPMDTGTTGGGVAVLSQSLANSVGWMGSGGAIHTDTASLDIVGSVSDSFAFPGGVTIWFVGDSESPFARPQQGFGVFPIGLIGRLTDGASVDRAADWVRHRSQVLASELRLGLSAVGVRRLQDSLVSNFRKTLEILTLIAALTLVVIATNATGFLLASVETRRESFATMKALGASSTRLQLLILKESARSWLVAASISAASVYPLSGFVTLLLPVALPHLGRSAQPDLRVILLLGTVSLLAALAGAVPSLIAISRVEPAELIRFDSSGTHRFRTLRGTSSAILFLNVIAASAAGVAGLSLFLEQRAGIEQANRPLLRRVWSVGLTSRAASTEASRASLKCLAVESASLTGVVASAVVDGAPVVGGPRLQQDLVLPDGDHRLVVVRHVSPGYLGVMDRRITKGRDFTWFDDENTAMISERLAFVGVPDTIRLGKKTMIVVGVFAGGGKVEGEDVLLPLRFGTPQTRFPTLLSRFTEDADHSASLRRAFMQCPGVVLQQSATLAHLSRKELAERTARGQLAGVASVLTFLLAGIGVTGLTTWDFTRRRRSLAVRAALGGTASSVFMQEAGKGLKLAIPACALGVAAGYAMLLRLSHTHDALMYAPISSALVALIVMAFMTVAFAIAWLSVTRRPLFEALKEP